MIEKDFEKQFDYGSLLPFLLQIIGFYSIYLMLNNLYSKSLLMVMIGFVVYVVNNIVINVTGFSTVFNEYLEDIGSFLTFGVTTIIFGFLFYKGNTYFLIVIFLYGLSLSLSLARDWILRVKNSVGWPISLNGIFFPLLYYFYILYLQNPGKTVFIFFYILITILSISEINFIGYKEETEEDYEIEELRPEKFNSKIDKEKTEKEKTEKGKNNDEIKKEVIKNNDTEKKIEEKEEVKIDSSSEVQKTI